MEDPMATLKVLFFLSGARRKASSRVRGFWMADEFRRRGAACSVVYGRSKWAFAKFLLRLPLYDVVYFQKRFSRLDYFMMKIANALGRTTLFDMDDAPFIRTERLDVRRNLTPLMKNASAVIVGSRNLLTFARRHQENAHCIPTSVALEYYEPSEPGDEGDPVCLGWIGHGAEYVRDLIEILTEPLTKVAAKHDVTLKLVGVCGQQALRDAFSCIPGLDAVFVDEIDWTDPSAVRAELTTFDVGLFPLLPSRYNAYKCGFKALEYMAMGIPVVASPVGVNSDIVRDGVHGRLADGAREWARALSLLASDPALRRTMGRAGREKIEKEFNLADTARALAEIMKNPNEGRGKGAGRAAPRER